MAHPHLGSVYGVDSDLSCQRGNGLELWGFDEPNQNSGRNRKPKPNKKKNTR